MDSGNVNSLLDVVKKGQLDDKIVQEFLNHSRDMLTKIEEVSETTEVIRKDFHNLEKTFTSVNSEAVAAASTDATMPLLKSINESIAKVVTRMDTFPAHTEQPSVRPKDKKEENVKTPSDKNNTEEVVVVDDVEEFKTVEKKIRKGIFFSSSIGLQCDLVDLQERLDSEIYAEKTFHIERHTDARDVEMYLRKNLDDLSQSASETDFIIISVGTNDITKLDLSQDISYLNNTACEHSKNIVELAYKASQTHNVDVFIVEKPPRFDPEERDPTGTRNLISFNSNGLLPSLVTPLQNVFLITLPSLNVNRAKKDFFKDDGVHLTARGRTMFINDIEKGIKLVYSDLKPDKPKKPGNSESTHQPSGRNSRDNGNTRRHNSTNSGSENGYKSDGWQDPKHNVRFKQDGYHSDSRDDNRQKSRFQKDGNNSNRGRTGNASWQGRNNHKPHNNSNNENRFHPDGRQRNNSNNERRFQSDGRQFGQNQQGQNQHGSNQHGQNHHGQNQQGHNQHGQNQHGWSQHGQNQHGYRGQDMRQFNHMENMPEQVREYLFNTFM